MSLAPYFTRLYCEVRRRNLTGYQEEARKSIDVEFAFNILSYLYLQGFVVAAG
jgi:hypothetical protein